MYKKQVVADFQTRDGAKVNQKAQPEISLIPAEGTHSLEIDSCTGLPKLPIEPLPEDTAKTPGLLALRPASSSSNMSTCSSPRNGNSPKRKSVTFDPATEFVKNGVMFGENSAVKMEGGHYFRKTVSDPLSVFATPRTSSASHRRKGSRPATLGDRSNSVFIRLQIPKNVRKTSSLLGDSDVDSHPRPPSPRPPSPRPPSPSCSPYPPIDSENDHMAVLEDNSPNITDDEMASPVLQRCSSQIFGRRSSFLYQSDSDEQNEGSHLHHKSSSRHNSVSSYTGDDTYVTPFAQILSTLHRVRSQYLVLVGLPEGTKTVHTRPGWTPVPSPNLSFHRKLAEHAERKLSFEVLEELDWCLRKLETINSAKSVGDMAHEKFRRLLNRELSHLSEGSKRGAQVAEWVTNITNLDEYDVDKALGVIYSKNATANSLTSPDFSPILSASLSHDNWSRSRWQHDQERRKIPSSTDPSQKNYCEKIPRFGADSSGMNKTEMEKYQKKLPHEWDIDTFHFDLVSGGNPLVSATYIVFKQRQLFTEFKISPRLFINFMTAIQNLYHSNNPYHNAIHATDVFLSTNHLLNTDALEGVFTNLEIMAALVAAAIHDVDHPGTTNQFLISIHHDLAILYNDNSVLENHHLATAFKTLQDPSCNFLERFDNDRMQAFRKVIIDMVLATDMAKHIQHLAEMKTLIETKQVANDGILVLDRYSDRSAVLQCLIHCADLGNPTKSPAHAAQWSYRIMEENFKQGDQERELEIPIHPMGDREHVSTIKCQISFIDFIIYPLWETWAELVYPDAQELLENLAKTREYWNSLTEPNSPPPSKDSEGSEDEVPIKKDIEKREVGGDTCNNSDSSSHADSSSISKTFLNSPANQRRTSYKSIKTLPIGQEVNL